MLTLRQFLFNWVYFMLFQNILVSSMVY